MPAPTPGASSRRSAHAIPAGLGVLGLLVMGTVASAPGAAAHGALLGTVPAAGTTVAAAPPAVSFTFADDIASASVTVTDACGDAVPARLEVEGNEVTALLRHEPAAPGGPWSVSFQAVGADGHRITDDLLFAVAGETTCSPASSPVEVEGKPEDAAAGATRPDAVAASPRAAAATAASSSGSDLAPPLLAGGAAVVVVGAVATSRMRRRGARR
jgi:methionine-rich copper-binding protein CopC